MTRRRIYCSPSMVHDAWKWREARWQASMDTILRVVEEVEKINGNGADAILAEGKQRRENANLVDGAAPPTYAVWRRRK